MYTSLSAFDDLCRNQWGKILQPKARCLRFSVPELPRLNDLVWLPDLRRDHGDRILQSNAGNGKIQKLPHERESLLLLFPLFVEPP